MKGHAGPASLNLSGAERCDISSEFCNRAKPLVYSGTIHWIVYLPAMALAVVALALLTQAQPARPD